MRRYLLCCALLLTGCGQPNEPTLRPQPHNVPPDLLQPCPGYLGPRPTEEGQLSDALVAEHAGRRCANGKLATIDQILNQGPR